jgi:hypothetical protein
MVLLLQDFSAKPKQGEEAVLRPFPLCHIAACARLTHRPEASLPPL